MALPIAHPRCAAAAIACWLACTAISPARAETSAGPVGAPTPSSEAQTSYRLGLALFDRQQYRPALDAFQQAYRLSPAFRILYNIAIVDVALADAAAASTAFRRYLEEGGDKIEPARIAQVKSQLASLEPRTGTLSLIVDTPNASVLVDRVEVGHTPLPLPLRLNPGSHSIAVIAMGSRSETRRVEIAAGDEHQLRVELAGAPPEAPRPNAAVIKPAPVASSQPRALWVPWTITGALGAATTITGIFALKAAAHERDVQGTRGIHTTDLDDARSSVKQRALATDILLGATAVAAGIALYLTLSNPSHGASTAIVIRPGALESRFTF